MMLLIDIGNTRIKWIMLDANGLGHLHAAVYEAWDVKQAQAELLSSLAKPERVLVANVGGESIASIVEQAIRADWNIAPEFIVASAQAGGVQNGYAIPEQLGVDRWLAVIGAYRLHRAAACVVSVGTAMTIDGVDAGGKHLGGVIVPGPELAVTSLLKNTSELATRSREGSISTTLLANNTRGAMHQGVAHMLAALIERTHDDLGSRLKTEPALLLTGGGCERITPQLRIEHRVIPDLVLQGLAVLAQG